MIKALTGPILLTKGPAAAVAEPEPGTGGPDPDRTGGPWGCFGTLQNGGGG